MAKVAIDLRMIGYSGIGTYVSNVVPRIVASATDILFYFLGSKEKITEQGWDGLETVKIIELRAGIYSVREQLELFRNIPGDVDLFWSPHYNIPILYRGKLLVTVHDACHLAMPQFFGGPAKRMYARLMFAQVRGKASAVICDSCFTASEIAGLARIRDETVHVIPLGIGEVWHDRPASSSAPHPRPYVIAVGNVKPHKNLGRLVSAFSAVLDRIPHDLLIVGKKEGFITGDAGIAERAAAARGRISFTGEVTQGRLKNYLTHADALVFPSLYEGFGFPPLEAMASGCPAIVSTAASIPEVCGDAALYFDPYDEADIAAKMLLMLDNRALREDYRARGLGHVRCFSWDVTAEKTLAVIRGLMER